MTIKRTDFGNFGQQFYPLKFQELPFLVLIIDSAFYDIDLRLLSSALGKTGRRISLSQLFWFDIDCSGDLSRLDKTALLSIAFFNSGLIGPQLRSDFWLNLCLRFGRTNLCGGGKIFTQKLIQTLFATSSWIFVGIFWIASLNLSHLRMENWTRNSQLFWLTRNPKLLQRELGWNADCCRRWIFAGIFWVASLNLSS